MSSLTDPVVPCTLRQLAQDAYRAAQAGEPFDAWWARIVRAQPRGGAS
jgi:hypothetical protein